MAPELLQHQVEGIEFLRAHPRAALFDEPGTGKSLQLIQAAIEPVLVVAPAMVLDSGTWDDEIAKWTPGIDATQVSYSSLAQRGPRGRVDRDQHGFPLCPPKEEYRRRWGTVICDESHYIKGRKTYWTKACLDLNAAELKIATGTPIPNWAHEAFTSLQAMFPEEARPGRKYGSYWRWAREWFHVGPTTWSPMDIGDLRTEEHVAGCQYCTGSSVTWEQFRAENWGDRMLLRLRADCLDLPPLTITPWRVRMGPEQKRIYKQLKKDFITWLEDGTEVVAWSTAGQVVKLAKAATGAEVLQRGAGASAKLDALAAILADRPLPTLVVGHFRDTVEACARVAAEAHKTAKVVHGGVGSPGRRSAIRDFQSGNLDVLCATIDTISEGMTLHQGGADQIIRVERSWRPSKNEQVEHRLHRLGVERPCQVIDLITEGTVDERVLDMLRAKTDQQIMALGKDELMRLA